MTRQIIYSRGRPANAEGRTVRNPRHFTAPEEGATKVYLDGSYPKIAKAYEAAGVSVSDISEMRALPKASAKPKETASDPAKPANPPAEGSSNSQ